MRAGERPSGRATARLVGIAAAGALLGLLPTLAYNTMTSGNPFWPTQGMEILDQYMACFPQTTYCDTRDIEREHQR